MTDTTRTTQTDSGRAFEWAVGCSISRQTNALVIQSAFSRAAETAYGKMNEKTKNTFNKAADIALTHILEKEKVLINSSTDKRIVFNTDNAGKSGDVRDVLLYVGDRELGISCKNNHEALKHPRLSGTCDFIKVWDIDANGCSDEYWNKVKPLFKNLTNLKKDSNRTMLWEHVPEKANSYYWPVLDAWADEINKLCESGAEKQADVCKSIISYLVGKHDFYKVICEKQTRVTIQGFNFNKTLATRTTKYPDSITTINKKNGGQYSQTVVFNHGYSINFRIHSASSRVEPSLKFDINAISWPTNEVYIQTFDIT